MARKSTEHPVVSLFYNETPTWERDLVEEKLRSEIEKNEEIIFEGNVLQIRLYRSKMMFELLSLINDGSLILNEHDFWKMVRRQSWDSKY